MRSGWFSFQSKVKHSPAERRESHGIDNQRSRPWRRASLRPLTFLLVGAECFGAAFALGASSETNRPTLSLAKLGYSVTHWTTEDGLPGTVITSLAQTPDGYLWCASPDGLCRFDGRRFRVFYPDEFPVLKGIQFNKMRTDASGRLWITGIGGELVVYESGRFRRFLARDGVPPEQVGKLGESNDGSFWFKGISDDRFFHYQDGRFEVVVYPGIPASSIDRFYADHEGVRWGVDEQERVMVRFTDAGPERFPLVAPDGTSSVWAGRLFWLQDGMLAVTSSHGIYALQGGQWELRRAFEHPIATRGILNGIEDDQGRFWVNLYNVGLVRADPDQRTTQMPLPDSNARPFHPAMLLDTQGNIWVASDSGLYRVRRTTFLPQPEAPERFQRETAESFVEDKQGTLWILHDYGWAQRTGAGWEYSNHGHPGARLEAGAASKDGSVILAYLAPWNPRDRQLQELNREMAFVEKRYPGGKVEPLGQLEGIPRVVLEPRANELWVGTEKGLWFWENGGFTRIHLPASPDPCFVRGLAEDREGRILVTVREGGPYRRETDSNWRLLAGPDKKGAAGVAGIHVDAEDTVWVATDSGLACWRENGWHPFTDVRSELPRSARTVISDEAGNLWIASLFGVVRLELAKLKARADGREVPLESTWFGRDDGLPSANCANRQGTLCRTVDGRIWVGTELGAAVVDPNSPQQLRHQRDPPPVYIETVLIDDRMLTDFGNFSDLTQGGELLVAPGARRFEFRYTAIDLSGSRRNRFRYRLEGLGNKWVDTGEQRTAVYHSLAPGHYRFQVTAANQYGVRNEQGASLAFFLQPFWWQTLWFRLGLGALILGSLGLARQFQVKQLRRKQARQEEFARQLIQIQEAERKRLAGELHDDLGQDLLVIKSRLDTSRLDAGNGEEHGLIGELAGSVTNLIRKVRAISHALRPLQLERLGLSSCVRGMVEEVREATGIHIETDIDDLRAQLSSTAEIGLYRILQEALNNVVKHSDASEVRVALKRGSDHVTLSVIDDGRGFSLKHQEETGETMGHGLAGMAERCRLMGGRFQVHSWPGKGTSIRVEAPVRERSKKLKSH
jgi:signal transduction histidine kinase/ligand-binding sensor domain-containing protein